MRIWSLHPGYLDAKGLVALWRETLLAKHVLEGLTTGYKNHPQLIRFKQTTDPSRAINLYLEAVYRESLARGYRFNKNKFTIEAGPPIRMTVTNGQLKYEWQHLLKKLAQRDPEKFQKLSGIKAIECHPLFEVTEGGVEDWEIV